MPCDTVGNPADPDASYNAHKGQGYMAQIVETYCEDDSNEAVAATPDLITHVEVHKMTVHDGHRLADALDDLSERALTPAVMLGDSHYGSSDNMALTREQNINLVAPARPPKGAVSGRLTLEDFTLNEEGLVLRCPNNVEPVSASLAKAKLQARFDLSICQKCPDILRCPVQAAKRDGQFSRFQYTPARAANQKRRLYEQSDAFRDVYRWRAGIEATMSRLNRHFPANLQIHGNRIYIAPPRELHSLRSPPMTRLWRANHVRKAIWQRFLPSRHNSPVFSTLPSISSAYAGTGLRRRSSIKAKIFWNKIFDTATSASWNVT